MVIIDFLLMAVMATSTGQVAPAVAPAIGSMGNPCAQIEFVKGPRGVEPRKATPSIFEVAGGSQNAPFNVTFTSPGNSQLELWLQVCSTKSRPLPDFKGRLVGIVKEDNKSWTTIDYLDAANDGKCLVDRSVTGAIARVPGLQSRDTNGRLITYALLAEEGEDVVFVNFRWSRESQVAVAY